MYRPFLKKRIMTWSAIVLSTHLSERQKREDEKHDGYVIPTMMSL